MVLYMLFYVYVYLNLMSVNNKYLKVQAIDHVC